MSNILAERPLRFRAAPSKGAKPRVDRTGGDDGAGIIYGASIVTEGEALGHRAWLDRAFIESVHQAVNGAGRRGVKMRFTHPSLSGDGLGSFLGRAKKSRISDDSGMAKSLVDIHLSKTAHDTPDGDLASYVMDLADADPEAFGVSIVFSPDYGAEDRFVAEHEDEDGNFRSPDKNNGKNYRHARLAKLHAADVVDDPAANPDGLFRRQQGIAEEADQLCAFALGLSEQRPELQYLGVDAERIAGFAARFLDHHSLELRSKEMAEPAKQDPALTMADVDAAITKAFSAFAAQLDEKLSAFGQNPKGGEPTADELRAEGARRASEIMAFAAASGLNDHEKIAQEAITAGQTVEAFKAGLADRLIAQNKLSKDGGDNRDDDPHAKFRAEFKAGRDEFAKFGIIDEDAYVRSRCRDEGLPVPPIKKAG